MLHIAWFESVSDLEKLTGLDRKALWDAGFDLDDWDFGIRVRRPLHVVSTESLDGYPELEPDYNKEGYWLLAKMQAHCVGATYVKLGRWHYYLCHHA